MAILVPAERALPKRKDRRERLRAFKGAKKMEDVARLDQMLKVAVLFFDVYF